MVDIHVRDISDPRKRRALVMELLEKTGHKNLVFEVLVARGAYDMRSGRVESYFGDYVGSINYLNEEGTLSWDGNTDSDVILVKVRSYTRHYTYYRGETDFELIEAGEGKWWYTRLNIRDLVNITQQASVEPVVKLKEIEAEAS